MYIHSILYLDLNSFGQFRTVANAPKKGDFEHFLMFVLCT